MKNNGFIATSLLYSFFLLFCALILSFAASIGHNTILLNKEIDKINEDIHSNKQIKDAEIGSYFRLNVCITNDKKDFFNSSDTIDYILFNKEYVGDSSDTYGQFISKNYLYKLNSLELLNQILNSIYIQNKKAQIFSRSMTEADFNTINDLNDTNLKNKILTGDFISGSKYLLANNSDNYYSGSKVFDISTNSIDNIKDSDISSDATFVRLAFEFKITTIIIGGDGTLSNPYILEGGASECE